MKNFVGERENFETLAARSARDILERLRTRHVQPEEHEAEPDAGNETARASLDQREDPAAGAVARPVFMIEIDQPEMAGSSIFIPSVDATEALDWGIMTEIEDPSRKSSNLFSLAVVLGGKVDDRTFVSLCYDHFLGRTADEDGLRRYLQALQIRSISRRDVMKLILASDEAMILDQRIALMPEPTKWLANYIPEYSADDPFPVFELRY